MRAWQVSAAFGLEHLAAAERPEPAAEAGEIVVAVRAASLNYRDLMVVRGEYNPRQPLPVVPLSDAVGEVVRVGAGVSRFSVGDRVLGSFFQGWVDGSPDRDKLRTALGSPLHGVLAERVAFREDGAVHAPAYLSDVEAATLPCAAVTAWSALVEQGQTKPGDTVLTQGTGGVSLFAIQIAKLMGARVIATSSRDDKLERARALGADEVINYVSEPAWGKRARALTGGRGVDHVIEVGGAGTLGESVRATRPGGTISVIGVLAGGKSEVNVTPVLMQNIRLQGVIVGPRRVFEDMLRAFALAKVTPVVDRVFPFDEAGAAFEALAGARHFGKICIEMGS